MQLYNTLTRQIDPIIPLAPPTVTVYTCGPTVYDYAHIGHWFNYVRMDILIRTLKLSGLTPKWVMNITDVGHLVSDADDGEDKLQKGARREGKTAWEIAEFYTDDFLECMQLLNISKPNLVTKATDHISEQIALIKTLEARGYTYVTSEGVYYDTSKFEGYAAFARLDLDGQQAGARVKYNPEKRNPTDFALWKFSQSAPDNKQAKPTVKNLPVADLQKRDMEWSSPWGIGFPGWHIECSAMSMKYLGDTLDIHSGGIDHIPVHHTNEIAQSEAATGARFALHWMHGNHVMFEGAKISKSLGNGIRLQEIIEKGISAEAVRLLVLESHYRSQSQFGMTSLEAAQNRLKNWQATAVLRWQIIETPPSNELSSDQTATAALIHDAAEALQNSLFHDLDTPKALATIDELFTSINHTFIQKDTLLEFTSLIELIDRALGTKLATVQDITASQQKMIDSRQLSRAGNDWVTSDKLRTSLVDEGIGLRDTPYGAIWYWL